MKKLMIFLDHTDRSGVLLEVNPRADRFNRTLVLLLDHNGKLVLDQDYNPARTFDIDPGVCFSQIEDS